MDLASIGFKTDTRQVQKAEKDLDDLAKSAKGVDQNVDKMQKGFKKGSDNIKRSTTNASQGFTNMRRAVGLVGTALGALSLTRLAGQIKDYSDEWTQASNKIRLVTESEDELRKVRATLLLVSNATRSDISATVKLYTSLTNATKAQKLSTTQLVSITKTINQLFAASGSSADEAQNAITQLAQGLAAGALRGDEFNSVAENAPKIMDALAEKLNMTRGELREFAATGGITAEIMTEALEDYAKAADDMFSKTEATFSQNMTVAGNNLTAFVGRVDVFNDSVSYWGKAWREMTKNVLDGADNVDKFVVGVVEEITVLVLKLQGEFEVVKVTFSHFLDDPEKAIKAALARIAEKILSFGEMALKIFGIDSQTIKDMKAGVKGFADSSAQDIDAAVKAVREGTEKEVALARKIYGEMAEDMTATTGKAMDEFNDDVKKVTDTTEKAETATDSYAVAQAKLWKETKKSATEMSEFDQIVVEGLKRVDNAFVDMWKNIGDGFSGFAKSLKNAFVQMLAELAHAAITRPIMVQIGTALGLPGASSLGGAASSAGGLGGVGSIGGLISKAGNYMGIESLSGAAGYSNLMYGGAGLLGGLFGSTAGGHGSAGGSLGAMAGMALGGPIGAVLGGVLGSAVGSLFGGEWEVNQQKLNLGLSGGDLTGSTFTQEKKKKLWKNRYRDTTEALDSEFIDPLGSYFDNLFDTVSRAADSLGIEGVTETRTRYTGPMQSHGGAPNFADYGDYIRNTLTETVTTPIDEWLKDFTATLSLDVQNLTEEEIGQKVAEWTAATSESVVSKVFGSFVKNMQMEGEELTTTLFRVVQNMDFVTTMTDRLNLNFGLTGQAAAMASTNIINLAGGIDRLAVATQTYYERFFSEEEKQQRLLDDLTSSFGELGLEMVSSRMEFRGLVEGLDLAAESGQKMFAALMDLVPAVDQFFTVAEMQQQQAAMSLANSQALASQSYDVAEMLNQMNGNMDQTQTNAQAQFDALKAIAENTAGTEAKLEEMTTDGLDTYPQQEVTP